MAIGAMEIPRLRRLLCAKVERYDDVPALREALGHPDTILCLGNGPSSEDPDVAKVRYDALFRVNSLWLKRGFLTTPDMVFTGSSSTLSAVRDAIFGMETIRSEIGRASCRERVCQYVSISVVAVSLKKTRKT